MNLKHVKKETIWKYCFVIITLIFLHLIFTFYSSKTPGNHYSCLSRFWGANHIKYYSIPAIVTFYVFALIIALPFINQKIVAFFEALSGMLHSIRRVKKLLFVALGVAAGVLFYIFRNKYFLLGDFTIRVNQTMKQDFVATEYLTMKLLYYIATCLGKYGITPIKSFVIVSCTSGGIFVIISCFISDLLGKTYFQKLVLTIGGTISGMLLVFCGYLDIYAIPVVLITVYLYAALLYIRHKRYFWLAALCLIIAIAGHLLCISFAPSLAIAWYYHHKTKIPFISRKQNKTRLYYIIGLTILGIIIAYKLKIAFVLPLTAPRENLKYLTLFSKAHIWEFINGQLLACGISFLFLFYLMYKVIKEKTVLSRETYFFITASWGMLLTVFLANLHRGSADWDIQSFTAVVLNTSVILLLLSLRQKHLRLVNYLFVILIGFNSVNAWLWIHINSSHKSLAKIEEMLANDPGTYYTSKLPGTIQLIYIYQENKLIQDAERIALKACEMPGYNDYRACMLYGKMLEQTPKRESETVQFYEGLMQRNQDTPDAYLYLGNYYQKKQQNDKMLVLMSKFYEAFKLKPQLFLSRIDKNMCLSIIEYWYNYNKTNNPNANLREMESIITQLKKLENNNQQKK